MRRALITTAATVAGLVALLGYKSSSSSGPVKVSTGASSSGATTTSSPITSSPTTQPGRGSSPTSAGPGNPDTTTTTAPSAPRTYTGENVEYRYGDIEVRVTVDDGRITAIDFPVESAPDSRSENINSQALPILTQEALSAQGVNIDVVSGATYTSDAFAQSLQSAIAEEKA